MKIHEKMKNQVKTMIEDRISSCIMKNRSNDPDRKEEMKKSLLKEIITNKDTLKIIRTILLTLSVLIVCYYGLQYGQMEYSILKNGQTLPGFVSSKKTVVTFCLGYSIWYSVISCIAAIMLVYSIVSKRPQFSLPLLCLFLNELVYDSCDMIVIVWRFFQKFQLQTALYYAAPFFLVTVAEMWMWLGVLRIYEHRNFSNQTSDSTSETTS